MLIYAIGDIHGRFDLLMELWARIEKDAHGLGYSCDRKA